MEEQVVFGKCLNELLMARGWSAARLARELSLDASYIRRWIRGDRVPSVKSGYVEQISDCLCSCVDSLNAKSLKDNFMATFKELGINMQANKPLNEIVRDTLTESQIYSLKFSSEERIIRSATTEEDIVNLLERLGRENRRSDIYFSNSSSSDCLNTIPAIIKGRESILHTITILLKAAKELNDIKKGEIILTFQSNSYPFDGYPELEEYWQLELEGVLHKGFKVHHILRLNKDISRSMKLVRRIIQNVGFDRQYLPYYFEKYGTVEPAYEIAIIEGIGALVCFSTEDSDYIDTAFFYNQPEAVHSLQKHYIQMFQHMKPLLSVFTLDDFFIFNTAADKKQGDRFIIRNDLDALSMPYSLWEKHLRRAFKEEDSLKPHLLRIKVRLDSFHQQVLRHKFMNVCTMEAVEHLIKNRKYLYDNVYRDPLPLEIAEHLENVIYLLKTYENFEIGLLNENQLSILPPAFWEVKGDYSVIIDMWHPKESRDNAREPGLFLAITEGTIAGSFKDYFLDLWEKIIPKYRDKEYVIHWFEEQLEWFRKEENITCNNRD